MKGQAHPQTGQLHSVQWIRVLLTVLVVGLHGAQPYGPTGGAWPVSDPANSDALLPFLAINAAFLMGFFFLAAYFLESSYQRKGAWGFLKGRLIRLGIPLALVVLLFNPVLNWLSMPARPPFATYLAHDSLGAGRFDFDHLWFLAHLLIYAALYVLWRQIAGPPPDRPGPKPPGHLAILGYAVLLGLVTMAVRSVWPQDRWVTLFGLVPAEVGHLPQYVSLTLLGILAGRGRWLTEMPRRTCTIWFWIGIGMFTLAIPLGSPDIALPDWLSVERVWAFLEGFVCIAMILGVTGLFRSRLNAPGRWLARLAPQVYGVYLVHFWIIIEVQRAILPWDGAALAKFAVATGATLFICFPLVAGLRRLPGVAKVL